MLHYLKFFHRKKFLKRPQFYYYKLKLKVMATCACIVQGCEPVPSIKGLLGH